MMTTPCPAMARVWPILFAALLVALLYTSSSANSLCGDNFPWDGARLPNTILPLHYDLVLHPNLTEFAFRGSVNIVLNVTEPSGFILLNSADLEIENVRLRTSAGEGLPIAWSLCPQREQMAVIFRDSKADGVQSVGNCYNLSMTFGGNLTDALRGLYRSSYRSENGSRRYMAVTQFSPTDARRMFPCWDEPLFKATFRISVIRDPTTNALSNMPLLNTIPYPDNLLRDSFETTLKMSTYIIAVVIFDFPKKTRRTKNGVEVSVYAPTLQIDQTSYALDAAVDALEFHEAFLKIPFPLKKLDIVAVGDFAFGAMENWGLMTFRETTILNDPDASIASDSDLLTEVMSHEVGHQWFGNLVTMKWWSDLWLKEGFASFLQNYVTSNIRPDWGQLELFGPNVISVAFDLDGLKSTHPVFVPVEETSDIRGIFDAISYSKGASIIFMLMNVLGEENLAAGLNNYLSTYKFCNAEGAQFWDILSKHTSNLNGLKLNAIADSWTLQSGHPYVMVAVNGSSLEMRQKRFYYLKQSAEDDRSTQIWSIPFTLTTDAKESKRIWFNTSEAVLGLDRSVKHWFKANINGTGFYRVLYDPEVWTALTQHLHKSTEAFSITDRSNLIMDAFGFVRAGLLNVTVALDLAEYLRVEREYGPWKAALAAIEYIANTHIGTPLFEPFRAYVRSLVEPVYKNFSWMPPSRHKDKRFASTILSSACQYNIGDCKAQALKLFKDWLANKRRIPPDFLKVVMVAAIYSEVDAYWDAVWNEYLVSNAPSEKTILLSALCSSPKVEKLFWLLNASLDSTKIRTNLLPVMATNIAQNSNNGIRLLWKFTKENWDHIYNVGGGTALLGNYLSAALINFSDQADLEDIRRFFASRDIDGAQSKLDQTLENIQVNIQWRKLNDADLESYTRNQRIDSADTLVPNS